MFDVEEALTAFRAGLAVDSLSTANSWYTGLGQVLAWRGDAAGARAAMERQAALRESDTLGFYSSGMETIALARGGRAKEARARLEQRRTAIQRGWKGEYFLADAFASLGEADSAFAWLDRGVARRRSPLEIPQDPFLAPLHSDPRYLALLKRIGLR